MLFITIISLIVAKALPVLNTQITSSQFSRITTISLIFSGLITLNCLNLESIGSGIGIYSGLFHITQISQIFEIFIFIIGGFILMGWYQPSLSNNINSSNKNYYYLENNMQVIAANRGKINLKNQSDYSLIILFSILGSSLLISSFDLISIYLSIELQSFGLYVLSTLYKDSESSTSSGLKYFLLGGLSSCIILLGIGIIYSYTGITNLESLYILNTVSSPITEGNISPVLEGLNLGLILLFVGFLFKIAAAPLHNWSPDVYDGTPTIVTSWLTIIPKISILILLLELQIQIGTVDFIGGTLRAFINSNTGYLLDLPAIAGSGLVGPLQILELPVIKSLLLISSLLSLIIGSLLGLAQNRIKRLLAYSTISHIGFILLALAINTEAATASFLFYIIQYTFTNLNIFLIILAFTYLKSTRGVTDIRYLSEFKGLFFSNPFLSLSLAISLFSMAGIPPLIGFFSKQFVLYSALQNGYYFISIIAIIVSVISASYYIKIVKLLVEDSNNSGSDILLESSIATQSNKGAQLGSTSSRENRVELSNVHSYLISTLTLTILFFFIKPSIILNSSNLLTLSLFSI
uniref:NADH-ubiquinone oxidoreductase chain 2 n=1 Tax=Stropharia rugosoannulata TaxID=68746 RepID=A0A3G9GZH9_9AGAR|nr:NADH dehydrogenase subunit 2 [Stropharia rugosoannulata]